MTRPSQSSSLPASEVGTITALFNAGRFVELERHARLMTEAYPRASFGWKTLGIALRVLGKNDQAVTSIRQGIALDGNDAAAHSNLGEVLWSLGRPQEAEASCRQAIALKPDLAPAHDNLANVLAYLGRLAEAVESYRRALALKPGHAPTLANLAGTLKQMGRLTEAATSYREAIRVDPRNAALHNDLGIVLSDLQQLTGAIASFHNAIALKPDFAVVHFNLGAALLLARRFEDALAAFAKAHRLSPDLPFLSGHILYAKLHLCDWTELAAQIAALEQQIGRKQKAVVPFELLTMIDAPDLQLECARLYAGTLPHPDNPVTMRQDGAERRRLRVGYFSADFHNHATLYLMAGLFEAHDKSRIESLAFSYGPAHDDEMRKRMRAAVDEFVDVQNMSDADIAAMARSKGVDIAVDLKGFTTASRPGIFLNRAAPIQVSYLGYPGTMGADCMDYLIADRTLVPASHRKHFAENIVCLPDSYQVNDDKRPLIERLFERDQLGLPRDGFVFCCFNSSHKITPTMFAAWMRILGSIERSVLWLLKDNDRATANLRREAERAEVAPARLVFAERMPLHEHMARHCLADLFLDTLPYNAHTTASDALWAGLPVLTCLGEGLAGRVGASLLHAVGAPELVTSTLAAYEALAVELAGNPERLGSIRRKLQEGRTSAALFDTARFARHLEAAYRTMAERHRAGLPPDHFDVAHFDPSS